MPRYFTQYLSLVILSCFISTSSISFLAFWATSFNSFSDNLPNFLISFSKNSFLFLFGSSRT